MRRRAFKSHLLEHKSAKRRRKKRRDTPLARDRTPRGASPPRKAIGEGTDGTRQAQRARKEEAPRGAGAGQGLPRPEEQHLPARQGAGDEVADLLLPRPARPQARLPPAVDHPHQRRRAPARALVQPVHPRPEAGRDRPRPQGAGRHRGCRSGRVRGARRGRQERARSRHERALPGDRRADHLARQPAAQARAPAAGEEAPAGARGCSWPRARTWSRRRWRPGSCRPRRSSPQSGRPTRAAVSPAGARRAGARGRRPAAGRARHARPPGARDRDLPAAPTCRAARRRPTSGVYLHRVIDPGNVGTVVRAAGALGPAFVALSPGCSDPLSAKGVRASMGAVFRVPLETGAGPPESGMRIALEAAAPTPIWEARPDRPGHVRGRRRAARPAGRARRGVRPRLLDPAAPRARSR